VKLSKGQTVYCIYWWWMQRKRARK